MISVYKRGRIWWICGSVNGQRIKRQSLDTQFRELALERAQNIERDIRSNKGATVKTWPEFYKEFFEWVRPFIRESTFSKYSFVASRFKAFMDSRHISAVGLVTPSVIASYMVWRRGDTHPKHKNSVGNEGIKSDLRILRRIFSYAVESGLLDENPVKVPRLNTATGKTLPFTQEEVDRMMADRLLQRWSGLRAKVCLFLYTGFRISDVATLTKKAVDLDAGIIVHKTQKRGKTVSLSIHPELRSAIEDHLKSLKPWQRFSPLLFPTRNGKIDRSIDAKLRCLFRRAKVESGHAHRFRDTFAVRLLEHGASLYDVSKLLGITTAIAERHYSPYVRELQERGKRLVSTLDFARIGHTEKREA